MKVKYPVSLKSWFLVVIQVLALIYLARTGPIRAEHIEFQIWQLSGLFLAISALVGLNWHSFSVFPEPKPKGRFIRTGVYAYIRHPMYAGVLMVCGSLVWEFFSWDRLAALGFLLEVFVIKILDEERYLKARFAEYRDYCEKTNRLIPFIW
jgi:protein-S-isoprenylcysteine O-methyltransferase Ste14